MLPHIVVDREEAARLHCARHVVLVFLRLYPNAGEAEQPPHLERVNAVLLCDLRNVESEQQEVLGDRGVRTRGGESGR